MGVSKEQALGRPLFALLPNAKALFRILSD
jgi:hypothetical protein